MKFVVFAVLSALTMAPSSHGSSLPYCYTCPPGWTHWENNCYRYYNQPRLNFTDAEALCSNFVPFAKTCPCYTAHLATVESASENEFLQQWWRTIRKNNSNKQNLFIGYTDVIEEGVWQWVDGSSSNYTNWGGNEPNGDGCAERDCAAIQTKNGDTGKWGDRECFKKTRFICKFRILENM